MVTTEKLTSVQAIDVPPGYWEREDSHNPRPLTPLGSNIFVDGLNRSFAKMFAEMGMLLETLAYKEIGGYVYNSGVPLGGARPGAQKLPPKPLLWLALRLHPMFRKRLAVAKRAMETRLDRQWLDRWFSEWRPRLIDDIARYRAIDVAALSDDELGGHFAEVWEWTYGAFDVHFLMTAPYGFAVARLAFYCRDYLGYEDLQTLRLLSGLSEASSEPAIALASIADRIRADAALTASILAAPARDVPALIAARNDEIAASYEEYVHRYGFRALRYEVVEQTMDEQPELIAQLLQDQLRQPTDVRTEQEQLARDREAARTAAISMLPDDAAKREFGSRLAEAERAYPTREDNEFFTVSVPLALVRRAALEAGRRLVKKDVLANEDDVFFARSDEIIAALRMPAASGALAPMVSERRAAHAAAQAFDPPASYGEDPPVPPMDVLPPHAREMMSVMMYMREKVFEAEAAGHPLDGGGPQSITGRPAARGTYTGTARLVMGEHEFDKLQPGDVLVCPITSPVWSVLFAKVGALVTDSGGVLSHPAIIAREYGIPAVVATRVGTTRLRDGQRISVDGDAGIVRILD